MPKTKIIAPDLGIPAGWGRLPGLPLVRCQGKVPKGRRDDINVPRQPTKQCPVHKHMRTMTNWMPPIGIDPKFREFYCPAGGHAFYVHYDGEDKRCII